MSHFPYAQSALRTSLGWMEQAKIGAHQPK